MATLKQKKLVKKISENLRKPGKTKPMGKLMREAGYSKSQSEHPKSIVTSKSFIDLLDQAGATDEVMAAQLTRGIKKKGEKYFDYIVRHKYLESGLKLKKHLNPLGEEAKEAFAQFIQIALPPRKPLPTK